MSFGRPLLLLLALVAVSASTGTALAQSINIKPGLWEMKQRPQLDPQRQAQMEALQKQMGALPAEQRKQMESMLAQQGVSMNFQGGELTLKSCVSREQAEQALLPRTDGKCQHETQRNGNQLRVTFRCTNPASEGFSDITLIGSDRFTTTSEVRSQIAGKTDTVRSTGEARWLGADCGTLQPQGKP